MRTRMRQSGAAALVLVITGLGYVASAAEMEPGLRPLVENPKQILGIRAPMLRGPMWQFYPGPAPKKWKQTNRYARLYCWGTGETVRLSHLDGVRLLARDGQPTVCSEGWILIEPGRHTLRIRDEDHAVDFEPVKYGIHTNADREPLTEWECSGALCTRWVRVVNRRIELWGGGQKEPTLRIPLEDIERQQESKEQGKKTDESS